jgi:hypothetical protein
VYCTNSLCNYYLFTEKFVEFGSITLQIWIKDIKMEKHGTSADSAKDSRMKKSTISTIIIIIVGSYIALNPEGTSAQSAFQEHHHYAPCHYKAQALAS